MTLLKFGCWYSLGVWIAIVGLFVAASVPGFYPPPLLVFFPALIGFSVLALCIVAFFSRLGELRRLHPNLTHAQFKSVVSRNISVRFLTFGVGGVLVLLLIVTSLARGPKVTPSIVDGKFVHQEHGPVICEISEDEYRTARREILQMFAGIMLLFSWAAVSFFWWSRYESAVPPPPEET